MDEQTPHMLIIALISLIKSKLNLNIIGSVKQQFQEGIRNVSTLLFSFFKLWRIAEFLGKNEEFIFYGILEILMILKEKQIGLYKIERKYFESKNKDQCTMFLKNKLKKSLNLLWGDWEG